MNTPQEQIALTKEWLRVQEMCLEAGFDRPYKCVKICGCQLDIVPNLCRKEDDYEFAVGIVEGRPVFVGDCLYDTQPAYKDNPKFIVDDEHKGHLSDTCSWRGAKLQKKLSQVVKLLYNQYVGANDSDS